MFTGILCIAPSDEVCQGALLCVQDALLVFEADIGLDFVSVCVEGRGLQANAIGEVAGQAQVDQIGDALLACVGAELAEGVSWDEATGLHWLLHRLLLFCNHCFKLTVFKLVNYLDDDV